MLPNAQMSMGLFIQLHTIDNTQSYIYVMLNGLLRITYARCLLCHSSVLDLSKGLHALDICHDSHT